MQLASISAHSPYWLFCLLEAKKHENQNGIATNNCRQSHRGADKRKEQWRVLLPKWENLCRSLTLCQFLLPIVFLSVGWQMRGSKYILHKHVTTFLRVLLWELPKALWIGLLTCTAVMASHMSPCNIQSFVIFIGFWIHTSIYCGLFCHRFTVFRFECHICRQFAVSHVIFSWRCAVTNGRTLFCQMALLLVHFGPKLPKIPVVPLFTSINGFGDGSLPQVKPALSAAGTSVGPRASQSKVASHRSATLQISLIVIVSVRKVAGERIALGRTPRQPPRNCPPPAAANLPSPCRCCCQAPAAYCSADRQGKNWNHEQGKDSTRSKGKTQRPSTRNTKQEHVMCGVYTRATHTHRARRTHARSTGPQNAHRRQITQFPPQDPVGFQAMKNPVSLRESQSKVASHRSATLQISLIVIGSGRKVSGRENCPRTNPHQPPWNCSPPAAASLPSLCHFPRPRGVTKGNLPSKSKFGTTESSKGSVQIKWDLSGSFKKIRENAVA